MAISYAWSFPTLDVVYSEDGFSNVVKTVHWIYTATDGSFSAYSYGTIGLASPGQPFTSYDDLTPEIVEGWVVSAMGQDKVDAMETSLASQVEALKNPTSGPLPPPWS
jgi:hypothetical protein